MSGSEVSALFAVWSVTGVLAEVPSGALADRWSRRGVLVIAGVLQAGAYALWTAAPGFPGFAGGFVLWGLGGALVSGAFRALVYDGLAAAGAASHYARVIGRAEAAGQLAQIPAAVAATVLFRAGGYPLVGWVSVACCLGAALLASALPEAGRERLPGARRVQPEAVDGPVPGPDAEVDDEPGAAAARPASLRAGLTEVAVQPAVRSAVLAVAGLAGLGALEEYVPLLVADAGVPTGLVPIVALGLPLAGAAGSACAASGARLPSLGLALALGVASTALVASAIVAHPAALTGLAVFYGLYRMVLVVADVRLQDRITGSARATMTSVASLGGEVASIAVFAAWALGGAVAVGGLVLLMAGTLPRLLRVRAAA
ncbi:MFS transporter [Pseudonocardia artemisiae]